MGSVCTYDSNVREVDVLAAGCSWEGTVPPPRRGTGDLHFCTAPKTPSPEIALYSKIAHTAAHPLVEGFRSDFPSFAGFSFAVVEKQKLKTLLLRWQMAFGGHFFLEGKNVCPFYDFICMVTLQCGWSRDAELIMPASSNQVVYRKKVPKITGIFFFSSWGLFSHIEAKYVWTQLFRLLLQLEAG